MTEHGSALVSDRTPAGSEPVGQAETQVATLAIDPHLVNDDSLNIIHTALFGWPMDHLTPKAELSSCHSIHGAAIFLLRNDRLRWDLRAEVPLWPSDKWVCTEFFGLRIWVNLHDSYIAFGVLHERWENAEVRFMLRVLSEGDAMVDVGANVGVYALQAARAVGPTGMVYAFEPQPDVFAMLQRSVRENSFSERTRLFNSAVGATDGSARIWRHHTNNPGASMVTGADREAEGAAVIDMMRLDSIDFRQRVALLKVDIEGYEPLLLQGGAKFFRDHRPVVLTEYFPASIRACTGEPASSYVTQWRQLGYRLFQLDGDEIGSELDDASLGAFDEIVEPFNIVGLPPQSPLIRDPAAS